MLDVAQLRKTYGATVALSSLTFSLDPGICIVAGPNGAGKTTLLRTVCGAERPTSGSVLLDGVDVHGGGLRIRRHISYLSDGVPLYNDLTVENHLIYRGRLKGLSSRRLRARIRHVTEILDLKPIYTWQTGCLSAGQRKRVGIADAMLTDVRLLAIDEPFDGLDLPHCEMLSRALLSLSRHTLVMLATHRLDVAGDLGGVCMVLASGALAARIDVSARPAGESLSSSVGAALRAFYASAPEVAK